MAVSVSEILDARRAGGFSNADPRVIVEAEAQAAATVGNAEAARLLRADLAEIRKMGGRR